LNIAKRRVKNAEVCDLYCCASSIQLNITHYIMLNWLKSLIAPSPIANTSAEVDSAPTVLDIFTQALQAEACAWRVEDGEVVLPNGLTASVEYLESQPIGQNAVRTTSKISCKHAIHFPRGIFEFQHASSSSEQESLLSGFRTWAQTDLATLNDAVAEHYMLNA
jgi:hypothetical protein